MPLKTSLFCINIKGEYYSPLPIPPKGERKKFANKKIVSILRCSLFDKIIFMAKVLDKTRQEVLLKLSNNEYKFVKNMLEFWEIDEDSYVFNKPVNARDILTALKSV